MNNMYMNPLKIKENRRNKSSLLQKGQNATAYESSQETEQLCILTCMVLLVGVTMEWTVVTAGGVSMPPSNSATELCSSMQQVVFES